MGGLFRLLYRYRAFLLFILLEAISIGLMIKNNRYQSAHFFNSSNQLVATMMGLDNTVKQYLSLQEINKELAIENTRLTKKLEQRNQSFYSMQYKEEKDSILINRFNYINAEVVNNSVKRFKNYITIDKGTKAGVQPGMGVVGSAGVVGKVKAASKYYALVMSLLNTRAYISSVIKNTNHFGTIRWGGIDSQHANLEFIPRHASPNVGDTVTTSGFNAIFPKDIEIGIISKVDLSDEAQFYDIEVKLVQDFTRLMFVKVIQSPLKVEKDSLEQTVIVP